MTANAADVVHERIHRFGTIGFDEFLEIALYAPGSGFYESGGRAGGPGAVPGHFLTSPSLGGVFGAVMARALDRWWRDLGEPDPFVVVEAAAGTGALCKAVLAAAPACAPALRYLLVERSETLRAQQTLTLPVEPAAHVLGPVAPPDDEDEDGARVLPGGGPRVASLPDLPAGPITGVVLANELLDNIPFALVERAADGGWLEVRVGAADGDVRGTGLQEVLAACPPSMSEEAARLAPDAPVGTRVPLQRGAAAWLRDAVRVLARGRVAVIDYAVDATSSLASRPVTEWMRTYRLGASGSSPLDRVGEQDVTCEVCIDQLARVAEPSSVRTQADFLADHGIGDLIDAARSEWEATVATGSLDSIRARARISEAGDLVDPAGLGAFRVIEWTVG